MEAVGGFLNSVLRVRLEEDASDRLSYQASTWLLLAFSLTLSAKQYVGSPLQCWNPAQFTGHWEQYVHDYCLVENTYWLHTDEEIPVDTDQRDDRMLSYYQWVPFILALMALACVLPHWFWRTMNRLSGLSIRGLGTMGRQAAEMEPGEKRDDAVSVIAAHLEQRGTAAAVSKFPGSLTLLYLSTKLLFILNLVVQFQILNYFLGPDHDFWGLFVLHDLASGKDWTSNGHFPRVTLCDFQVRVLGNVQRHTVQCVLMINMFNEKIFLFLWWWFALVMLVTIGSLLGWLAVTIWPSSSVNFVKSLLATAEKGDGAGSGQVQSFIRQELGRDGILVLRLMTANSGSLITAQVVGALWTTWAKRLSNNHPPPVGFKPDYSSDMHKAPLLSKDEA